MPQPRFRARTMRRVFVKTSTGKVNIHYKKRKHAKLRCHNCGVLLIGMKDVTSFNKRTAKSKKRPERPYGGVLCSRCMRAVIIDKVRSK